MKALRLCILVALGIALMVPGAFAASKYPSRNITFIVPYPPGGNADVSMRALTEAVAKDLGVNIVVTPIPGAAAVTGLSRAFTSKPDGYTVVVGAYSTMTIAAQVRKLRFTWDTPEYIGTVASPALYLGVPKDSGKYKDFAAFVAAAKVRPGEINIGQIGQTGIHQVMNLRLMKEFGYKIQPVPFDGGPPTVAALLGGHVDAGFTDNYNPALRPLFLTGDANPNYPGVKTLTEMGHGDIAMGIYYFIAVPKGTPKDVLRTLETAFAKAMKDPTYLEIIQSLKWSAQWRDAAATRKAIESEAKAVAQLIDEGLLNRAE